MVSLWVLLKLPVRKHVEVILQLREGNGGAQLFYLCFKLEY